MKSTLGRISTASAPWSLQTRVELISTLALCTGLVVGSVSMFSAAAVEDDQVIDQRVEILARRILQSVEAAPQLHSVHKNVYPASPAVVDARAQAGADLEQSGLHMVQVWLHDGSQLLRTYNTTRSTPFLPIVSSGYKEISLDGERYCVYSAANWNREIVVQVAEKTPARMVQIGLLLSQYLAYILLPFAFIFWLTRRLIQRAFQPLESMADNLRHRGPRDVQAVDVEHPPQEMLPIVHSLNSHFSRIAHAMSVEQRFTSVAAHELRTPLAGIRAQAQMACKASDPGDLQESLASVIQGVDKAARVIDQLIDLHRVETVGNDIDVFSERVDLHGVFLDVMDELGGKAAARHIGVQARIEVAHIQGIRFAIYMLMRNLVANAVIYCPQGSRVEVSAAAQGRDVVLGVDDSGPGIPPSDRDRVFEKFNRLGRGGADGVGLGLSIVSQVAQLHRAKIEMLESPLGGLRVQVTFHEAVVQAAAQDLGDDASQGQGV